MASTTTCSRIVSFTVRLRQYVSYGALFPYAMFFTACAFYTMSRVKHGDSRPTAKKTVLENFDMDD